MGELRILNRQGDLPIRWQPDNSEEVQVAKDVFESLKAKGYLIFKTLGETRGEQVTTFDPNVGEYLLAPPMRGG